MKTLLPLNHPTYLRRLARELNALPDGFYCQGKRWNRASVTAGWNGDMHTLHIHRPHDSEENTTESTGFASHENVVFSDAYGRSVCAPRS